MKRCVIITASPISRYDPLLGIIDAGSDYVICADGGTRHLKSLHILPDIVIGDLDSAGDLPEGIEVFKFKAEKDETDTLLAVMYGLKKGFRDFLILGGLDGRLDHTYANLCTLQYIVRHGAAGHIMDGDNEAYFIENSQIHIDRREGYYLSVFPFGGDAIGVTETGFKYEIEEAVMHSDFPNGVSNEFLAESGLISVKNGSLLIILARDIH